MCDEVTTYMVVGSSCDTGDVIGRVNIVTSSRSSLDDPFPVTSDRGQKDKVFPFSVLKNGKAVLSKLKGKTMRGGYADTCIKGKASIAFVRTRTLLVGQKPEPTLIVLRGWSYEG